jgi:signal recognition particle subunit SRP68
VLSKTQEKAASSLTEVSWLGKKVPVRSERLRVGLVKLQLVEGELARVSEADKKMEVYETLLMECQDTMQAVREEITMETVSADVSISDREGNGDIWGQRLSEGDKK